MVAKKEKKCRQCKTIYLPWNSLQTVCSPKCALSLTENDRERKEKKERREFNRETKRRKEAMKTRTDWHKELQDVVNRYIRVRDFGKNCISCEKPPRKKNAGHYLSVGAHPELRFNILNIHLQCEYCNTFKSGNQAKYRINLIDKIGEEKVDWLEGPHEPLKYDIEYIKRFKRVFSKKTRRLEARRKQ